MKVSSGLAKAGLMMMAMSGAVPSAWAVDAEDVLRIGDFILRERGETLRTDRHTSGVGYFFGSERTPDGEDAHLQLRPANHCFAIASISTISGILYWYVPGSERGSSDPLFARAPVHRSSISDQVFSYTFSLGTWPVTRFLVSDERRWYSDLTSAMRDAIVRVWQLSDQVFDGVLSGDESSAREALRTLYDPDLCTPNGELTEIFRPRRDQQRSQQARQPQSPDAPPAGRPGRYF